jgi:3-deoxy-7-phosphoheptulonate synthase
MLLRLRKNLSGNDLESFLGLAKELGYSCRFLDASRQVAELAGPERLADRFRFEDCAAVVSVLDPGAARERTLRAPGQPDTVVEAGPARIGGPWVSLIAGPCAVEDYARLLEIARSVRRHGAVALRGGAFKPRTSPYSYQGTRRAGLEMLAQVRRETGLAIITECLDPREAPAVAEVADVLQVGSRNMHNSALLAEIGATGKPVLLKRGFMATLREFLLAAEYLLDAGCERVVLCERGIRSFDHSTRNVLDLGAVAALKLATHLPVIVDPSHAAGRADLVRALARAALAVGADGLMIEVHSAPVEARSDGAQAITPDEFQLVARDAMGLCSQLGRSLANGSDPIGRTSPPLSAHDRTRTQPAGGSS